MRKKQSSHEKPTGPALASGIPVFCAHTRIEAALSLKRHPENPKIHPSAQLDRYEQVVKTNGFRRAAVISARSGFVVNGNGLVEMAARRGWDVPVEVQEYDSNESEIADLLADNHLAELAETNEQKLADLLGGLGASLEGTGFDSADLAGLLERLGDAGSALKSVDVPAPPKMAWVLIGLPLVRFAEINQRIEELAAIPDIFLEISHNDQEPETAEDEDDAKED